MEVDDDQDYTTATDDEGTSTEAIVQGIKEKADNFARLLDGDAPPLERLHPSLRTELKKSPLAVAAWNLLFDREKDAISGADASTSDDDLANMQATIARNLEFARAQRQEIRSGIKEHCQAIIVHLPQEAIGLFRMYITLRKYGKQSNPYTRKSLEALSDRSETSGGEIKDTLTGDNVHHNMFTRGDFREQNFIRFGFPDSFGTDLPDSYDEAAKDLTTLVDFLSISKPRAREDLTQALFSLFMENLVATLNTEQGLRDSPTRRRVVVPVTGMETIDVQVTIGEQYLQANEELRSLCLKRGKKSRQVEGDWDTLLSIKSDLVVCPISAGRTGALAISQQQKQQFVGCDLHIEMKRFRLLVGSQNKSELTQVCAESLARKSTLDSPQVLYSLLTDSCGFYGVCHVVKPDGEPDEYWVSRQENDPMKVVAMIRWLLQNSLANNVPDLSPWKEPGRQESEGGADEESAGKKSGDKRSSGGRGAPTKKKQKRGGGEGKSGSGQHAGLSMTDLWGDGNGPTIKEQEEIETNWSVFYGQQYQRQAGQAFRFSGDLFQSSTS